MGIECKSNIELLRSEILLAMKVSKQDQDRRLDIHAAQLADLQKVLNELRGEHCMIKKQMRVIESLHFVEFRRRFDQIPEAHQRSNEWIFDSSLTTFTTWLESTVVDDGIFYIFGNVSQ
jgi:hypothetical protein